MLVTDPRTPVQPRHVPRLPLLKALTSVRFFAALHVALYHFVRPFSLWGLFAPAMRVGFVGVSFFFFLSGYILTYTHADEYEAGKGDPVRFWIARVARIYPVYLLSMILAGIGNAFLLLHPKFILVYVADLLMLQSWSVHIVNFFHVTAWSLSVEAFFYFLFPLILLRLKPPSSAWGWAALGGFWLLAMVAPALCVTYFPLASWQVEQHTHAPGAITVFRVERLPLLALPEFLAGVSLGWIFLRWKPRPTLSIPFALIGILGTVASLLLADHLPGVMLHDGLLIPFFALLILGLSYPNWIASLLSAPWLMLLGEASFSLYLIHFMVNQLAQGLHAGSTILDAVWKLALVLPLSIALHLWVERPGRRIILRWWTQRTAARAGLGAPSPS